MSTQQIQSVTNAAVKAWSDSESDLCYSVWIQQQFHAGRYWGAKEVL